jgi:hypothetical protein
MKVSDRLMTDRDSDRLVTKDRDSKFWRQKRYKGLVILTGTSDRLVKTNGNSVRLVTKTEQEAGDKDMAVTG